MPVSITIITNEFNNRIEDSRYFLAHLVKYWNQLGIKVHVTDGCNYIPADIAFLHVDTSVVADEYLELAKRYPVALNDKVRSILKSSISNYLLKRDDPYTGPVIVKTDANYGGANEFNIAAKTQGTGWIDPEVERPWRKREIMNSLKYPIFKSLSEVPNGVWKNSKLVVEKFLPQRLENGEYRCCTYVFFRDQECAFWMTSTKPVLKSIVATDAGVIDEIPQSIRRIRNASGFDYGKFDFTEVDGETIVYDMNKTPALGSRLVSMISDRKLNDFANELLSLA